MGTPFVRILVCVLLKHRATPGRSWFCDTLSWGLMVHAQVVLNHGLTLPSCVGPQSPESGSDAILASHVSVSEALGRLAWRPGQWARESPYQASGAGVCPGAGVAPAGLTSPLSSSLSQSNRSPSEVVQWSNHRVMEWLRSVDLAEYAPNLRGSGVHGGLIVSGSVGWPTCLGDLPPPTSHRGTQNLLS